jgi:hypothetical protein
MTLVALGELIFGCTQLCKEKTDRQGNENVWHTYPCVHRGLVVLDGLAGITLIVLAILAMNNILSLPAGMAPALTYAALAVGALNLIISLSKLCCHGLIVNCLGDSLPTSACAKKSSEDMDDD